MFPGEYICLDCGEEFGNITHNPYTGYADPIDPRAWRAQAIIHACETGHENFQMLNLDIKVKIKTKF